MISPFISVPWSHISYENAAQNNGIIKKNKIYWILIFGVIHGKAKFGEGSQVHLVIFINVSV